MTNGKVIHLDSDQEILDVCKRLFDQIFDDIDYVVHKDKKKFNEEVLASINEGSLKCLIFDLVGKSPGQKELGEGDAEFIDEIEKNFASINIPIFIYSGSIHLIDDKFESNGTVFKVDKAADFEKEVISKFQLFLKSGFIDVFCPGGTLETEIRGELHTAFINQFSHSSQIEEVIQSIKTSTKEGDDYSERVKSVFKRIAVRTLSSDLLAPVADSKDTVNPIEHFYRRQSKLVVWTGDIWKNKEGGQHVLVLTPRCDFATGKATTLIYCFIEPLPKPISLKGNRDDLEKRMRNYLMDNLQGKSKRYIPSTAFFNEGGMADLANHHTMESTKFAGEHDYVVTLSDDLTNEIIGKFAYYFLRTGITNISEQEFEAILRAIDSGRDDKANVEAAK